MASFPIDFLFLWLGLILVALIGENSTKTGILLIVAGLLTVPFAATISGQGVELNKDLTILIQDVNADAKLITPVYDTKTIGDTPLLNLLYWFGFALSLFMIFGGIFRVYSRVTKRGR